MLKLTATFVLLFTGLIVTAQTVNYSLQTNRSIKFSQLENGFQNPPAESRLRCYWWWLNSMATKESITRDLEEMKSNGYGGASFFDAGGSATKAGPVFM